MSKSKVKKDMLGFVKKFIDELESDPIKYEKLLKLIKSGFYEEEEEDTQCPVNNYEGV